MKIGIDISILSNKFDGIGFYLIEIINELKKHKNNDYYLYSNSPNKINLDVENNFNFRISTSGYSHTKWLLSELKEEIAKDEINVFLQPNYIMPYNIKGCENVVIVYDLSGYLNMKYVDLKTFVKQRLYLKKTCKKAHKVITLSEYSKLQICKYLNVNESKVKVIYGSIIKSLIANEKYVDDDSTKLLKLLNDKEVLIDNYYLFVGTFAPRKNDKVIIDSFIKYINNGGKKKLIIAGGISKKSKKIVDKIKVKYSNSIIFTGYIDEKTKAYLYNNCFAVLYPSRLEGFGIPILEAMSYSKPLITSYVSSIPEVANKAAVYLKNINDFNELCDLYFYLEKMNLDDKKKMIEDGISRVKYFDDLNYPFKVYMELMNE